MILPITEFLRTITGSALERVQRTPAQLLSHREAASSIYPRLSPKLRKQGTCAWLGEGHPKKMTCGEGYHKLLGLLGPRAFIESLAAEWRRFCH